MHKRTLKLLFFLLILIPAKALNIPDISEFFNRDLTPPEGTLLHYRISQIKLNKEKKNISDYWVYFVENGRVESLYKESNPGAASVIHQEIWIRDNTASGFSRHIRKDLITKAEEDTIIDFSEKIIQTRYTTTQGIEENRLSVRKELLWSPTLNTRDRGIWFISFMPLLKPEADSFTLCLNDKEHLILMRVESEGEEIKSDQLCRKYSIKGQGLLSGVLHKGAVWLSREEQPVLIRMEQTLAFSWKNPRLRWELAERSEITCEDWKNKLAER